MEMNIEGTMERLRFSFTDYMAALSEIEKQISSISIHYEKDSRCARYTIKLLEIIQKTRQKIIVLGGEGGGGGRRGAAVASETRGGHHHSSNNNNYRGRRHHHHYLRRHSVDSKSPPACDVKNKIARSQSSDEQQQRLHHHHQAGAAAIVDLMERALVPVYKKMITDQWRLLVVAPDDSGVKSVTDDHELVQRHEKLLKMLLFACARSCSSIA